jgi:hypothetical protein
MDLDITTIRMLLPPMMLHLLPVYENIVIRWLLIVAAGDIAATIAYSFVCIDCCLDPLDILGQRTLADNGLFSVFMLPL